jgi:hypothetical protein
MTTCIDPDWLLAHPQFLDRQLPPAAKDRAHPYPPGSGPKDQNCGTCAKLVRKRCSQKTYFKCHVMRASWTAGPGTDIRCKDLACKCWEPQIDKIELVTTIHRRRPGRFPSEDRIR